MNINVVRASVIIAPNYPDKIMLETDLPIGMFPFEGKGQILTTEVAKGAGVEYTQKLFGEKLEIQVVDIVGNTVRYIQPKK